jgi:hypothetical protein
MPLPPDSCRHLTQLLSCTSQLYTLRLSYTLQLYIRAVQLSRNTAACCTDDASQHSFLPLPLATP